mmetsp:Transcript_127761/g.361633  ORF Transcript_127761/g.361633 Transcript_127761/m.361633 type:complete len:357 (+) Transcript_127761:53-1123(+)
MPEDSSCVVCHGGGALLSDICPLCDGFGFVEEHPLHSHGDRALSSLDREDLWSILPVECSNPIAHLDYGGEGGRAAFLQEHVHQSRPTMIHGLAEAERWPAASRWNDLAALVSRYGHHVFELKPGLSMSLGNYVQYAASNVADHPFYLSERGGFAGHEELLGDFATPAWFGEDVYDWLGMAGQFRYFLCGGRRTGTHIHADPLGTCAWNTSFCGHKRWVLLPPGTSEEYKALLGIVDAYARVPPAYWFMDVYPGLKRNEASLGMVECIQNPGDTIFVPAGWWHIVLNLDTTVAVTMNHMLPAMLPRALRSFDSESPAFACMLRQELRRLTGDRGRLVQRALRPECPPELSSSGSAG